MKKLLLVTAVATAMSGTAFAGSAADGLYGKIRLGLQNSSELDVVSGKLVFGFKGNEDLGNGLNLSYGIEFENDSADAETNGNVTPGIGGAPATVKLGVTNDKSWLALSGGFGKVIIGEHSDMAGFACGATDILTYGTAEACSLGHNTSPANAIQYRNSAGAIDFGVAMTFDGSGESGTLIGLQFDGGNFTVGAQLVSASDVAKLGGVAAGESGHAIGGSYTMGDIVFGITAGDDGVNGSGTDLAVSLPLAGGTVAVVISSGDLDESTDIAYTADLGRSAYYGVEINTADSKADDVLTAFIGTGF